MEVAILVFELEAPVQTMVAPQLDEVRHVGEQVHTSRGIRRIHKGPVYHTCSIFDYQSVYI